MNVINRQRGSSMHQRQKAAMLSVVLLLPSFTGCATIINGRTQDVALGSTPAGAVVKLNGTEATTPGR